VTSPLWLDEALSVNIAGLPVADIGGALRQDGHPPLYYWLLHGWMSLVGDGDRAARSLSLVLWLAALPAGWLLGHRIGGRAAAAWTVVLLSISPYTVRYATEARMYSLVMLLVLVGGVLVLDALERPTPARLVGIAAVAALLVYSQYWAFYLLAALVAVLAWRWRAQPRQRAAITRIVGALAVGGATFVLWLPAFLDQLAHTGTPWSTPARPSQVIADTLIDLGGAGLSTFSEGVLYGLLVALLVAVSVLSTPPTAAGEVRLTGHGDPLTREIAAVAFGTLAIGAVVGFLTGAAFNSRYASTVVPLLLVLAAVGITRLPRGWPMIGCAVGLVVLGPVSSARVATLDRTESGDLAAIIIDRSAPGDAVLVCPDQLAVSVERALRQSGSELPIYPYPDPDADPGFVQWRDYEERNDAADPTAIAGAVDERVEGSVWLVTNASYRTFEGDCEEVTATLTERRGGPELGRDEPAERAFEHADLLRFGPAG
jgi:mannosyltransferase